MIDWKRKLTSRKFWAAVCGFVSMVVLALGKDASTAQTVTGMIMAAGSLIAYMIGEGLADSKPDEPIKPIKPEYCDFTELKVGDGVSDYGDHLRDATKMISEEEEE